MLAVWYDDDDEGWGSHVEQYISNTETFEWYRRFVTYIFLTIIIDNHT